MINSNSFAMVKFNLIHHSVSQNSSYSYQNATFSLSSDDYEASLKPNSHFICLFDLFGTEDLNFTMRLSFKGIDEIERLLTPDAATMVSLSGFLQMNHTFGSNTGGYTIGPVSLPTFYPTNNYQSYTFTLKIYDRGEFYPLSPCKMVGNSLSCTHVDVSSKYLNWNEIVKLSKFDLFVGSTRFVSVSPFSSFYCNNLFLF
jgi:hypothetical protein